MTWLKEIDSFSHMTGFIKNKQVQILGLRDRDDLLDAETIRLEYLESEIRVLPISDY